LGQAIYVNGDKKTLDGGTPEKNLNCVKEWMIMKSFVLFNEDA